MPVTIGIGAGLIGGIGKLFSRGRANRDLSKLQSQDPLYKENPIAAERLALAKTLFNARMPGSVSAERNIYGNQANQFANINRNATDSSQALALGAATQGQTNSAFNQLGLNEANDAQRRYQNLIGAQEGEINEGDKMYQDEVRRYGDKAQILGAQNENRQNSWGEFSKMGFGLADFGLASESQGNGNKYSTGNGNGTSFMSKRRWY